MWPGGSRCGDGGWIERADGVREPSGSPQRHHALGRFGPSGRRSGSRARAGCRIGAGCPPAPGNAARVPGGDDVAAPGAAHGGLTDLHRLGHHHQPGLSAERRTGRPGAQYPVLVPREHRRHHLRGRDLRRLLGVGHRAHGLAGRPLPATAHCGLGHLRLRPDGGLHGIRHQHLRLLPRPPRRRRLPGQHHGGARFAPG